MTRHTTLAKLDPAHTMAAGGMPRLEYAGGALLVSLVRHDAFGWVAIGIDAKTGKPAVLFRPGDTMVVVSYAPVW